EVVYFTRRLNGGDAQAPNADTTHIERILPAAKEQSAAAPTAAADVGRLHLVHLDGAVRDLTLDGVRSERDLPRAPGEIQDAHTHERQASHHRLPRLLGHRTSFFVACVGIPLTTSEMQTYCAIARYWGRSQIPEP